jgi:hypothetical protein
MKRRERHEQPQNFVHISQLIVVEFLFIYLIGDYLANEIIVVFALNFLNTIVYFSKFKSYLFIYLIIYCYFVFHFFNLPYNLCAQ